MGSKLFDMLSDLAKSPKKREAFKADPDGVMTKYGLSKKQRALLKSAYKNNRQHDLLKAMGDEVFETMAFFC
jgi:hypothetical protein